MYCPECNENLGSGGGVCPNCGASTSNVTPEGDHYPVSTMEAVTRPLNFSQPGVPMTIFIGALVNLIPFIGAIAIIGYRVEYIRKIVNRRDAWKIPDLTEFNLDRLGSLIKKGLPFFLALLVLGLGLAFVNLAVMIPFFGTAMAVLSKVDKSSGPAGAIAFFTALFIPMSILFLVNFIFSMIIPLLEINYATGSLEFSDAFKFGRAFELISKDTMGYLTCVGAMFLVGVAAMFVNSLIMPFVWLPVIGQLAAFAFTTIIAFVVSLISTSVFAEFYYKNTTR